MAPSLTTENFINNNWNTVFQHYQLTTEDLKKPIALMGAVFHLFDRLGIDNEAVLMPPAEKNLNENSAYYWDLIPVINMTRVINRLVSVMPEIGNVSINHFLQPSMQSSHSILLLLFNLMLFNEGQLQNIAPYEEELFSTAKLVKDLEQQKNDLLEKINGQVQEKGKRAERMEQMEEEIRQLEAELQAEEEARDQEKQELDALIKENNVTDVLLDQKKATKEGLLAERERKRALRVYDAEDIKHQAAQAAQNVQEADEKLNSLQTVIAQKEASLKILHMIKPNLDTANNLLHEINKLRDLDLCTLDEESQEGELEVLQTEERERAARAAALAAHARAQAEAAARAAGRRRDQASRNESTLREAEEKDRKRREFVAMAAQRVEELKQDTITYSERKVKGMERLDAMRQEHQKAIKDWEQALYKLVADLKTDIERKQRSSEE